MRACAIECNFICPFDDSHDLTEYQIINRIRCGVSDPRLQQELLLKHKTLMNLKDVIDLCTNFESAENDRKKLTKSPVSLFASNSTESIDDELVAAISSYKRKKANISINSLLYGNATIVVTMITLRINVQHKVNNVKLAISSITLKRYVVQKPTKMYLVSLLIQSNTLLQGQQGEASYQPL